MSPKIIFEDSELLIVDKPAGLVTDRSETQQGLTLEDWLKQHYDTLEYHTKLDRVGIVHRLDKNTSGLLIVAKTPAALENLQAQFKGRKIKKEYLALVHGIINEGGVVEGAIGRNPRNRERFVVMPKSLGGVSGPPPRWSVTEYEPIKLLVMSSEFIDKTFYDFNKIQLRKLRTMNYQLYTFLVARPKTGRTHQIRVHLKYIGHPVVSDEKYGGRKVYRLDKRWCPRMFLHAKRLGFYHPVSGEWMEVESELAEDLEKALKILRIDTRN